MPGDVAAVQKTINTIVLPTRIDAQLALDLAQSMRGAIEVLVAKLGDQTSSDTDIKIGSGALSMAQTRNLRYAKKSPITLGKEPCRNAKEPYNT